ncbi:MAG TPA: ClpXP protease specificity-enhancing factor SspB [Polyangiaceae bacterium]|jgi:stringent starvation protein B|nr:ClpXP protease specificity-enhancing factor SspB [Polyangiaceae bacterium]
MTTPELPPKKDVMLALLERSSVFIHLDPRREDVRVPAWFKKQPQLVLQVGLNMAVRIPDLDVADDAVSCTLSFSRSPFFCYMPWSAVFALVSEDGKGMLWPNDIPPEVAAQQAERAQKDQARERLRPVAEPVPEALAAKPDSGKPAGKKRRTAKNRPEKEPSPEPKQGRVAAEPSGPSAGRESKRPLPPYLRVVK